MRGLHGLIDYCHQLLTYLFQVDLVAQRCTESCQRARCIILAPVEATVDGLLDAPSQGLEEGRNHQSGDDRHRRRLLLAGDDTKKLLQQHHEADVDTCEDYRERAVNQRAIDENIDIPQAVA